MLYKLHKARPGTEPALDDVHVVLAAAAAGQQLVVDRAAGQQDAGVVLAHGDEVLLGTPRAAGVVVGQLADGVADGVVDGAAHLEGDSRRREERFSFHQARDPRLQQ